MELGGDEQIRGTILESLAHLSVNVNGLLIPARSIESALARHALNLWLVNDDEVHRVSLPGSATAIRYRGRELLLTTQHQLRGWEWSRVAMIINEGRDIVTSGGARWPSPRNDTDANDLVVFDFSEPCEAHPELRPSFFDLGPGPSSTAERTIVAFVLSGYPNSKQKYELEEANHIGVARLTISCALEEPPNDTALLKVRALRKLGIDLDGMSGGCAFAIELQDGKPHAHFAGIILRGGEAQFYVLRSGVIRGFLNSAFAD